tara:strand:+ start:825 stop:1580 length:756 start_codon:yes stop_codon:yes gene_type:complete
MGFMDKFGTGEGWLAKTFSKEGRKARKIARRDNNPGTALANRMQNQINRMEGTGGRIGDDNYRNPFKGDANTGYAKGQDDGSGLGDLSQFNVQNKHDVLSMQKKLFPNDPSQWDGMFGPNTEKAYRNQINAYRQGQGLMGYNYGEGFDPNSISGKITNTVDNVTDFAQDYASGNQGVIPGDQSFITDPIKNDVYPTLFGSDYLSGNQGYIPGDQSGIKDYLSGNQGYVPDAIQEKVGNVGNWLSNKWNNLW